MIRSPSLLMICAFALALPASAEDHREMTALEIWVEADAKLFDATAGARRSGSAPLANAIVFVPMIRSATMSKNLSSAKRLGIRDWLPESDHAKQKPPVDHEFRIRDGKIVPSRKIIRVNDRVKCNLNASEYLSLHLIANSPASLLPDWNAYYQFDRPEPIPVKIFDSIHLYEPAWAVVLDHDLARITDSEGIARFDRLPVGMDIPFHILDPVPRSGRHFGLASETAEIVGPRFVFFSADGAPQRHTIQLIELAPK